MKYLDMILDAIVTLADRKGSSRAAIWKCISQKYVEADYKQFLIRLRAEKRNGNLVEGKNKSLIRVNQKLLKKKASSKKVQKTEATMSKKSKKASKNSKKSNKKGSKKSNKKSNKKSMKKKDDSKGKKSESKGKESKSKKVKQTKGKGTQKKQ